MEIIEENSLKEESISGKIIMIKIVIKLCIKKLSSFSTNLMQAHPSLAMLSVG